MPNNNTNRNRSGHPHDSRPSPVDPFNGDNYVVGSYNNGHHQPDSPSAFSQLTTATRRDDGFGEDYDGPVVIRVIAPATLQEGYEFDVLVDDEPYTVRVPKGGVKENQEFEIDYDPKQEYNPKIWYDDNGTPIGGWRTHLCSCCDVLTQSTFWMGFCCTPILMAQLITRLKLTWNGREGSQEEASLSYNRLILALVFTLTVFWIPLMGGFFLSIYYIVVIVCIGSKVRGHMRQKYKIPSTLPTRCGDRIDDVCLMLCCGCCSSIQMARHTHDDKDYPGHGCTTTGLEFDAPEIV
ncbi:hypothetical protein FRACYDRAFT_197372 [Fragilariopsis cylindrus CCMP1102]|uniref:PLAC8-domain-containing protein n=1 Tax=Fragilariopsis cylindrus CCMP1102 TaxID=635003 RepID=A0A1E7ENL6_9STRA|nr:hypothetical protein FRACYDRAFT_197372 [Fragilariopsis cylindrus CCMP1102]|eukprot:OEU07558.1 hypothetical protein FRACYDRAFT_197372 [Fragilariopsis cylindrus CCMP1102]